MRFKQFLAEAQFGASSFDKVLVILERRIARGLGMKIFRYGGPEGKEKLSIGGRTYDSYLYFFGEGKAFRFNSFRYNIESIDIWKEFRMGKAPEFTINVGELNSVAFLNVIDTLIPYLKNPVKKEIPVYFLPESVESSNKNLLTEARRSTPVEFFKLCVAKLDGRDLTKLSWEDINLVAAENDVQVPTAVRANKTGKGTWSVVPPGMDSDGDITNQAELDSASKKGNDPIYYIKITAQDPQSKKFLSTGEDATAQKLYKQIQDQVLNGAPTEKEVKDPKTLFGHMAQLVKMVAQDHLKALLIMGGPGIGKSFTVYSTIKEAGLVENINYIKLTGKATPISLYQTLYMWRNGGLVVFDDLDSIWQNEDAVNILKGALDSYDKREISWGSNRTLDISKRTKKDQEEYMEILDKQLAGEEVEIEGEFNKDGSPKIHDQFKYPAKFEFKGKIIFISNLKESQFDSAILSRSAKINMDLTPEQVLMRMRSILPSLGPAELTIEQKEEIIDHLLQMNRNAQLSAVTMRDFIKVSNIVKSGVDNWKELSRYA